ncbi:Aminoglycoside N(6')-acetyltransferase type 1 [Rickettsiales bacterium Ac37b]|nr:Aminoglycoside N(6')-acetyltransferase type 1 [Rickettsiales bacterium Ac37b]
MDLKFQKLETSHFPLLYKWLMTPHVRKWWDNHVAWTPKLIEEKYSQYVKGYKRLILTTGTIQKPFHAYIILKDDQEIGYIQYYNKHDFPSEYGYEISNLPLNLAAIDWYIGEIEYLHQGIGTKALNLFIENYVFSHFDAVFVDPDSGNVGAIRSYEKAGFVLEETLNEITWMLKRKL